MNEGGGEAARGHALRQDGGCMHDIGSCGISALKTLPHGPHATLGIAAGGRLLHLPNFMLEPGVTLF